MSKFTTKTHCTNVVYRKLLHIKPRRNIKKKNTNISYTSRYTFFGLGEKKTTKVCRADGSIKLETVKTTSLTSQDIEFRIVWRNFFMRDFMPIKDLHSLEAGLSKKHLQEPREKNSTSNG
jgi:hypothetical protein